MFILVREGREIMISLKEISLKTGISYTTVARYTKVFEIYFPRQHKGRKLLFLNPEAIETAQRVNELYKQGNTTEQIHEILQKEKTATVDIKPIHDEKSTELISHMKKAIIQQQKKINELERELDEIKQQQAKDKSEILSGVNDLMLEYMQMMQDKKK